MKEGKLEVKRTPIGHIGLNRFEDGDKASAVPNQVIEEWIDETLQRDEEEKAQDLKEGSSD